MFCFIKGFFQFCCVRNGLWDQKTQRGPSSDGKRKNLIWHFDKVFFISIHFFLRIVPHSDQLDWEFLVQSLIEDLSAVMSWIIELEITFIGDITPVFAHMQTWHFSYYKHKIWWLMIWFLVANLEKVCKIKFFL